MYSLFVQRMSDGSLRRLCLIFEGSKLYRKSVAVRGFIVHKSNECAVCRLIRFYLFLAVPLIAMVGLGSLGAGDEAQSVVWLARVELIDFLAWGSAFALIIIVAYRGYVEFWIPKRRSKALAEILRNQGGDDAT